MNLSNEFITIDKDAYIIILYTKIGEERKNNKVKEKFEGITSCVHFRNLRIFRYV